MNLIPPGIQFVRALAFCGCLSAFLGWNAAARAAEPPPAIAQSNALTSGTNSAAGTNAMPAAPQPAANEITAAPTTNTAAVSTNLSQTAATNAAYVLDDKHKLAIGDVLSFRILEDEEDPKEVRKPFFVTDSGDLDVPYIGRVPAEGKTCRQLAAEIKAALEKDYYYQATVIIAVDVMTKSHGRVYLVGALRLPGPVELPSDEVFTLSKAILRSGGFTDYADRRHVNVTRKGATDKDATAKDITTKDATAKDATVKDATAKDDKETFIVDVGEIFDKGKIETDLTLESGDLIYVPDSRGRVYLSGAVRLPGPVEFPTDEVLTLSKAILRAGGFTDYADKRHVKVTRKAAADKDATGKDVTAKDATPKDATAKDAAPNDATAKDATAKDDKETFIVDVGEILDKGKIETDMPLESGDMISVPERLIRF